MQSRIASQSSPSTLLFSNHGGMNLVRTSPEVSSIPLEKWNQGSLRDFLCKQCPVHTRL